MMVREQLSELFEQLRTELQVRDKPELRAIAKLGVKPKSYGAIEEPYADESFKIWEDVLLTTNDDLTTIQHLAIMHHARAFDLEQSNPSSADEDWKSSLKLWYRLYQEDEFWDKLANRIDKNVPNPFPEVRKTLPEKLLQVHFDIAFDESCKNYRRCQHILLALKSPFSSEVKHKVRLRSYERVTSHIPEAVWDSMTFDEETLKPGIDAIAKYLDLDENFLEALSDLLDLLTKYQTGFVQYINVTEDSEVLQQKFKQIKALGDTYEPYIKRVEEQLQQLEAKLNTVSNLILWHSRIGQTLWELKDYEKAASHYYRAFTVARKEQAQQNRQEEMRKQWLICLIMAAHEYAATGEWHSNEKARELLNSINRESQLPPLALILRANTHMLFQEFELAEQDCLAALEVLNQEQNRTDYKAAEVADYLIPQCQELLERIRYKSKNILNGSLKTEEAVIESQPNHTGNQNTSITTSKVRNMQVNLIPNQNISIQLIKDIFDSAFVENTLQQNALLLQGKDQILVNIDPAKRFIEFVVTFRDPQNQHFDRLEKLNSINKGIIGIKAFEATSESIEFRYLLWLEGGTTAKNIVLSYRIFLTMIDSALITFNS